MTVQELTEKLSKLHSTDEVVVENMYGEWVEPRVIFEPGSPNTVIIMDSK